MSEAGAVGRRDGARLPRRAACRSWTAWLADAVRPASREETCRLRWRGGAGFIALIVCYSRGYMLLYGDAVAHLGIARRILDSRNPGLAQLGGVWLPLPHLLMLPFVQKMEWWQNGLAGRGLRCLLHAGGGRDLPAGAADDERRDGRWWRRRFLR